MALQHYVSAEWVTDEMTGTRQIKAIGDDDLVYWIPEVMCDVPPWPQFLEDNVERAEQLKAEAER